MSPEAAAHSLAGATVLQIVPSMRDEAPSLAAIDTARMLLQSGARAIIAGDGGPLAGELRAFGGEFFPMPNDTFNPIRLKRNVTVLRDLIQADRIDIVHAQSAGAAWSALAATDKLPVFLVTSLPDRPATHAWPRSLLHGSLARGDRVIAPSSYVSLAMIERYKIPAERVVVVPRSVDTARFSPAAIVPERIAALRRDWGVLPGHRIVLAPGRLAPWNGQMGLVDAARLLVGGGERRIAFVLAGNDRAHPRFTRAVRRYASAQGLDTLFRLVGPCLDMPAAHAAADVVVVPALQPPLTGRAAAEAQAMGRPVVVNAIGMLPENLLSPPRMPDQLRTGWVVRPGDAGDLARGIGAALALDQAAYAALEARARQFAEFMFSPQSVADAMRGVYTSLLSREA